MVCVSSAVDPRRLLGRFGFAAVAMRAHRRKSLKNNINPMETITTGSRPRCLFGGKNRLIQYQPVESQTRAPDGRALFHVTTTRYAQLALPSKAVLDVAAKVQPSKPIGHRTATSWSAGVSAVFQRRLGCSVVAVVRLRRRHLGDS